MTAPSPAGGRTVTSAKRLRRLLALVPFVVARRRGRAGRDRRHVRHDRAGADRRLNSPVRRAQSPSRTADRPVLRGRPGHDQPGRVDRPPARRLAADEASALLVALRMLAEAGGDGVAGDPADREDRGCGGRVGRGSAPGVPIQIEGSNQSGVPAALDAALAAGKRVHLRHYNHSRDEVTERDVDPRKRLLALVDGRTTWEGRCRRAEAVREFRLHRVLDVYRARRARLRSPRGGGVGGRGTPGCSGRRRRMCRLSSSLPQGRAG